ncbi:hypothetical protein IT412_05540 [Candidatus Peregrinibacteria bacterium]|nr:hypothetical protein [Candidatus Peregrinibacteria bacterium]
MNKLFKKLGGKQKGSALLITLLLMGFLMTLTLGISALVIREIGLTQSIVDANIAYYSAEAGSEQALYGLAKNKAGYEPMGEVKAGDYAIDPNFAYKFVTSNTTSEVPGFSENKPIFVEKAAFTGDGGGEIVADCVLSNGRSPFALAYTKDGFYQNCARATYRKLGLNETAIIPLFNTDLDGNTHEVQDFLVQYYLNVKDGSGLWGEFQGLKLESFDVLRWKLYGQPASGSAVQRTESIADFYPGITNNGPDRPVCIGTEGSLQTAAKETCVFPSLSKRPPKLDDGDIGALNDVTLWSAARECYQTDAGTGVTGGALIKGTTQDDNSAGCQMRDFIDNHKENYLILTNMVNPNIVGISNNADPAQLARADIYYRVIARKAGEGETDVPKLVKDYAEIRSEGYAQNGKTVKTLETRYKAPGFLPVFNFSLYKTESCSQAERDANGGKCKTTI